MSKIIRALAFLVAVCCLTWVGVLWWWQHTGHSIEVQDVVIYLGLLPLMLVLLLLALRWAWQRSAAQAAAVVPASAGASAGSPASGADAASASEASARHAVVQLVHAATCTLVGDQVSDLLDAAEAGKPLPQPDGELTNDDGLPVMCARVPDKSLPLDDLRAELDAMGPLLQQRQPDWTVQEPGDHLLRALAALREPLLSQRSWLQSLDQALKQAQGDRGEDLSRLPPSQRPPLPSLRVLLAWPAHWSALEQAVARLWVERLLSDPAEDLSTAFAVSYTALAGSGEELWLRADQLSQSATRSDWLMVAACHSDLDQDRVDSLSASQRLYQSTERPGGCIPGEAAAALLLAPAEWKAPEGVEAVPLTLHRPALLRRGKPVESAGRVGHQELGEALAQALTAAQIESATVGALVCDGDQHSHRTTELYGVAVEALPHLDPVEDMRLQGKVTGYTGVASWLLVLAGAAEMAKATKLNTLALGLSDSVLRMAVVVKFPEEPDAAA